MGFPKEKEEILKLVNQYHSFLQSGGKLELYPNEMMELEKNKNVIKYLFGVLLHSILFVLIHISKTIKIWPLVAIFSKIRILTDSWALEPRQCGYNRAYTLLGIYRLRSKNISGAISALNESWQVYPCPHNTSFGLYSTLAKELKMYPEAKDAVEIYKELYDAFKA
jgi:hypothetical protein